MATDIDKLEGMDLDVAVFKARGGTIIRMSNYNATYADPSRPIATSGYGYSSRIPFYHRSLDACAPLLEEMRRADALVNISPSGPDDDLWCIDFGDGDSVWARPLPTAICRAWLHWKGAQNEGARGEG